MKRFLLQALLIVVVSTAAGTLFNTFSRNSIPVFRSYEAGRTALDSAKPSTEDPLISEIDTDMLLSLLESNQVILLDARDRNAFSEAHIPSAISLPVSGFERQYEKLAGHLRRSPFIVTYADQSSADKSYLLARMLHRKGLLDVFVFREGFEAWQNHWKKKTEMDQK